MGYTENDRGGKQAVIVMMAVVTAAAAVIVVGATVLVPKFAFFVPWTVVIWAAIMVGTMISERGTLFHRNGNHRPGH
ncbi:hypothetical protein ACIGDM_04925 [Rothia koreensis]|jgi:hypothetical protein|uniref:hypothetical protein n=1 Tax=Rothia koreensis TaxID=592378 RepID=UPI0037C9CB51